MAGPDPAAARRAHAVDPEKKAQILSRLNRIEGQVRGLQRMVEEERYCADILMQVASVQQALSGAGKLLMRNHLEHCITEALRSGDPKAAESAYDELMTMMYRYAGG